MARRWPASRAAEIQVSTQRVDKSWQQKGLKEYSTEALLGTLGHYGIAVGEDDFRKLAETAFPLGIAQQWRPQWKGTGPFKDFAVAAAVELWSRWLPDRVAPMEMADTLANLMQQLSFLLGGRQDAAVDAAFEKMNAVRAKMPLDEKGAPQERFMREALAPFTEKQAEIFDSLAEALASSGHVGHAESFADLEEFLLPDRRGISRAIVRAAKGELQPATEDMVKLTEDTERSPIARLLAVDGLIHIKAHGQAAAAARTLLAAAENGGDLHLALDLVPRLEHVYKAQNDRESLLELMGISERLEAAHDKIHPGHRRHRH
ncbi:hypothetical protein MXAN_1453 [Myxococcus xanthus DK 1622]|uniref:Uncharacterized protein n=1 Tax=Myxococcus xanthus (strain DK1622) TaxID=246197 RepID=Q1DCB3_MYXXD|nr:hypothetical protein MXAN_1453 [Myxococcus xanthus DK 1622]NOJ55805.1 hypothetical protein [Myxococcus xanthus]QPM81091.1 hypothetical protein I5Q59_07250 [Myxococcus xanthus]QVW70150.1 hypothetical protein JTM82_11540 [Myxococcus xanthus DZ2]UEO03720.1 hypothetical protein K1515_31270 [Myxococcus xanthus DZ2]